MWAVRENGKLTLKQLNEIQQMLLSEAAWTCRSRFKHGTWIAQLSVSDITASRQEVTYRWNLQEAPLKGWDRLGLRCGSADQGEEE